MGRITHIQRMSIHDGPGIRSTVFFKGCNMRCQWCHNPETWSYSRQLQHISSKCIKCYSCVTKCPENVFISTKSGLEIHRERCSFCEKCTEVCTGEALSIIGENKSADEIIEIVKSDKVFYELSGGGITLSGGEPLLQADFAYDILKGCKEAGINTAVESNLSAEWEIIDRISEVTDIWMCDLKIMDEVKHLKWTGLPNRQILENIKLLAEKTGKLTVRTPVIPDVNDSEKEIGSICRFLSGLKSHITYELLGFHTFGFDKFANLGMGNPIPSKHDLSKEKLDSLKDIVSKYNLK